LVKLAVHSTASQVVELLFDSVFSPAESRLWQQEFYGPSYKYFKIEGSKNSLADLLVAETDPLKRDSMLKYLVAVLKKLAEKGHLRYAFVHDILFAYLTAPASNTRNQSKTETSIEQHARAEAFVDYVKDISPALCSTRRGALSVVLCAVAGGAKARKRIVKSFKDDLWQENGQGLAHHVYAHRVVVALLNVVDDTVLLRKNLLSPLYTDTGGSSSDEVGGGQRAGLDRLFNVAMHQYARKLLIHVLEPGNRHAFDCEERATLAETLRATDAHGKAMSRKPSPQRREELLKPLKGPLEAMCMDRTRVANLLTNEHGAETLACVTRVLRSTSVYEAVAEAAVAPQPMAVSETKIHDDGTECVIENAVGHFAIQTILKDCGADGFASCLFAAMNSRPGGLASWITPARNRPCFVIATLLASADGATVERARAELAGAHTTLNVAGSTVPGAKVLSEKLGQVK
jgi:hypothetical protein